MTLRKTLRVWGRFLLVEPARARKHPRNFLVDNTQGSVDNTQDGHGQLTHLVFRSPIADDQRTRLRECDKFCYTPLILAFLESFIEK